MTRRLAAARAARRLTKAALNQIDDPTAPGAAPWLRPNHRGAAVDLRGGLAVMTGLLAAAARARPAGRGAWGGVAAISAAGVAGFADDLAGDALAKGLRGHLRELARGRVTTGFAKLALITAGAAVFAAGEEFGAAGARGAGGARGPGGVGAAGHGRPAARLAGQLWRAGVDTVLVAGAANLANLLDLRPGRALKAAGAPAALIAARGGPGAQLAAGVVGTVLAAAPADLTERVMLGDTGANALGAAVGVAAARSLRPGPRAVAALAVAGLTLASEKVSFSRVIAGDPVLRRIDSCGRLE
jgi:UDP-N-acetylmuramyl pentapeptide phosphotransferase/UDP-N-acetylglucosamine-1-phosphate transferase